MERERAPRRRTAPHAFSGGAGLFNEKAAIWGIKYDAGGVLANRLDRFARELERYRPAPANVLDFGCGTGQLAEHLAGRGYRLTGCDIAEEMVSRAKMLFGDRGAAWVVLEPSWQRLPFVDGQFDAVVASSVLEYVDDVAAIVSEISRVVTPVGLVLATVPDPRHVVRKIERSVGALFRVVNPSRLLLRSSLARYASYLELSKNRAGFDTWKELFGRAGMTPAHDPTIVSATEPLRLLVFRRCNPLAFGSPQ